MIKYIPMLLTSSFLVAFPFSSTYAAGYHYEAFYCVPVPSQQEPNDCYKRIQRELTPETGESISNITVQMMSFYDGTLANTIVSSNPNQLFFSTGLNKEEEVKFQGVYDIFKSDQWPVIFIDQKQGVYHPKQTTVLKKKGSEYKFTILASSGNYTENAMYNNYENLVVISTDWFDASETFIYNNVVDTIVYYISNSIGANQAKLLLAKEASRQAGWSYSDACDYFISDSLINAVDRKLCTPSMMGKKNKINGYYYVEK